MEDRTCYCVPQPPLSDSFSSLYSHHHNHLPPQALPPVPLHYSLSPPPPPSHSPQRHDEVRTLFISGLPRDVKPREIYHLFREFPGYISSNLRTPSRTSLPFAFAEFLDHQSAVAASHALNGMVFDLEKGSSLHIELARANSRSKRQRAGDEGPVKDKKLKVSSDFLRDKVDAGVGSFHIPGMDISSHNLIAYPPAQSHLSFENRGICEGNATESNDGFASTVLRDKSPCPTIFVANLGPKCSEKELHQVFSRCWGFLKLKMQSTYGAPVAFVDFKDTTCSTEALVQLQGTLLQSSPAGEGLRLEYAKSRMGKQRRSS